MVVRDQNGYNHPCLLGVPMVVRGQNGYITPSFWGSPWWGELNLEKSGCGGGELTSVKKGENG